MAPTPELGWHGRRAWLLAYKRCRLLRSPPLAGMLACFSSGQCAALSCMGKNPTHIQKQETKQQERNRDFKHKFLFQITMIQNNLSHRSATSRINRSKKNFAKRSSKTHESKIEPKISKNSEKRKMLRMKQKTPI